MKRPTSRLVVRERIECLLPPAVFRFTFEPRSPRKSLLHHDLRVVRVKALLRVREFFPGLRDRLLGAEVFHVEETALVEHHLLLSTLQQRDLERLECDYNLDVVLGAILRSHAILGYSPLNFIADLRLLQQGPGRCLVVTLPETAHFVHSDPDDAIVVYPHVQAEVDLRVELGLDRRGECGLVWRERDTRRVYHVWRSPCRVLLCPRRQCAPPPTETGLRACLEVVGLHSECCGQRSEHEHSAQHPHRRMALVPSTLLPNMLRSRR